MKKLINFKQIKIDQQLFFLFLSSFFATLLIPNNKFYILLFLFFGFILFFYFKKSFFETIFLTFIFSLPFENSIREWIYQITPRLFENVTNSGYILYFGISIKLILATTIFLFLIFKKETLINQKKILTLENFLILIFLLIACINTLFKINTLGPIFGLIRIWMAVLIFITSKIFFSKNKNIFFIFITSLYFFSIIIGGIQLIKQKPLGKYIELTPSFSQDFGYSTTDGDKQYRVSGFISHPVYFASFLSILLPIYIGVVLTKLKEISFSWKSLFIAISIVLGCLIIFGTLSRSAFLTLLISLFLLRKLILQKIIIPLSKIKRIKNISFFIFSLTLIGTIIFIIPRIKSFTLLFAENGNGSIRFELIKKSLEMIFQNPLGVGLNNFTNELIKLDIPPSLYGFIVPVHNTFLIFFTELGIPGGIIFTIFIFSIFLKNFFKNKKNVLNYSIWIGILTFIINSQIHPLFNLDPTFDLLMLVLAYYSIANKKINV